MLAGFFLMQILRGIYVDELLMFALTKKLIKRTVFCRNWHLLASWRKSRAKFIGWLKFAENEEKDEKLARYYLKREHTRANVIQIYYFLSTMANIALS